VAALITHRFNFEDADKAYSLVVDGHEPSLGVVLRYVTTPAWSAAPITAARPRKASGRCTLGVIGAGAFARAVLLPILSKSAGVRLKTVVTSRGASASQVGDMFGFAAAGTDPESILTDPEINAVIIATPHGSHAALTARALENGKHVFVEKPLALSRLELNRVIAARSSASAFFMIGFNRRFAPMSIAARKHLESRPGPRFLVLRINAGPQPRDGWLGTEAEGGGRILGEACHFVDLAQFLVSSAIRSVHASQATKGGAADDVTITLGFADGSLATIAYTGLGDPAYPKENIELYAAGTVIRIDDFRTLTRVVDGREIRTTAEQDKGHRAEMEALIKAVSAGGPAPVDENELISSSLATLAALESLSSGARIEL